MEISYGNFSQTYCGDEEDLFGDPGPFTNISTTMEVKFKTDSVNPRSGFLAVVCCDVNVTKVVMSCELNLTYTIYFSTEFLKFLPPLWSYILHAIALLSILQIWPV